MPEENSENKGDSLSHNEEVSNLCEKVCDELRTNRRRLVLAESCSAGLIAAELGHIPGISDVLTGSFVAYQVASKISWLGVNETVIQFHDVVSQEVAEAMAAGALHATPHADICLSVTGHVGPNSPSGLDGLIWTAVADREVIESKQFQLGLEYGANTPVIEAGRDLTVRKIRVARQYEVVQNCLRFLLSRLQANAGRSQG